jgi:hypothetical protein
VADRVNRKRLPAGTKFDAVSHSPFDSF